MQRQFHTLSMAKCFCAPTCVLVSALPSVIKSTLGRRGHALPACPFSDPAKLHPLLRRHATIGAALHSLRAGGARALMPAGHGKVSLRASKAHDARGVTADGGFRSVIAAGDIADIGECQHLLSIRSSRRLNPQRRLPGSHFVAADERHLISSRRVGSLYCLRACWRMRRRAWKWNTPAAAPAAPAAPTASASSTHV